MEVRQELLFNMTAAYNYDESKEKCSWSCLLGIEGGIFKFSVGNYEALSGEPLPDSYQIFHGRKNAQPVALLKISACSQAMKLEIRLPTVLMLIETIREKMIF